MKKIMRPNQFVLLAGLSLSTIMFSSCDKEDIMPVAQGTTTPPGSPTTTPQPGSPTTTPPPTNPATTPPPVTTNSLVKEFDFQVFTYDAQNRLVEVVAKNIENHGYQIVYEGNRPSKLNFKNGNYLIYTYEGDKVVKAVTYSSDNKVNFDHRFEYSGDKLVKQTTITYVGSEKGHLAIIDFKYDANGNLTEQVLVWSPTNSPDDMRGPSVIKWGDYDNKPNPLPYITGHDFYLPGVKISNNNPGYRELYGKEFYTYTYHASGMPKERTLKLEREPEFTGYTATYSY